MKVKLKGFIAVLIILTVMIGSEKAYAFKILDGALEVTGYLEVLGGVRLMDDNFLQDQNSGDWANEKNTIQVQGYFKLLENIGLNVIFRDYYQAMFDIDSDLYQPARKHMYRARKVGGTDDVLRECYADIMLEQFNLNLKIGKQQVVWGEADGLRMADIVNSLEFTHHYVFDSWEDIRNPMWMFFSSWRPPILERYSPFVELVWNFKDFEPTRLPPEGAQWSFPGYSQAVLDLIDAQEPKSRLFKGSEYGLRLGAVINGWDIKIFNWYSRTDLPVIDIFGSKLFKYPWINQTGVTFNKYCEPLKTVFRFESVFITDQPINNKTSTKLYESNTIAYMIGFDRPTFFWFQPTRTFFLSGQVYNKFILDHKRDMTFGEMSEDSYQVMASFLINTGYMQDKLMPQLFIFYDFTGSGWMQPQMKWKPGDYVAYTLGANLIWGHKGHFDYFSPFRRDSEVYLRIRFEW